jgi:predicted phosphodiesterase
MRIAIVSDIHGNLPALEAVMKDLESQNPDAIWCAGDLGWGGPWARECIEIVRDSGWPTVKGNTDIWIAGDPQGIDDPAEREQLADIAASHGISKDHANWLVNLPLGHSGPGSILMVHATPHSPFDAPLPDDPSSKFSGYETQAGLVIYGHVHRAFVRRLQEGTMVANAGSVGLPLDLPSACYLVIDLNGPDWTLRHRRVDFDRAAVIKEAEETGGPASERFLHWMRQV